ELCHQALELEVLPLKLLQPLGLIEPQPAVLLAPAIIRLLCDPGLAAGLRRGLATGHRHFDLPQEADDLFRLVLLGRHTSGPPARDPYYLRFPWVLAAHSLDHLEFDDASRHRELGDPDRNPGRIWFAHIAILHLHKRAHARLQAHME